MDAHKFKHYKNKKKVIKSEGNNGDAEVYVLPPDLLQKLGINLGTVDLDATAKTDVFELEQIKTAESKISCNSDKTISETASLLKESMLIMGSPTLTSSVSKIAGEIEISNEAAEAKNASKVVYNGTGKSEMNERTHQNQIDILVNADLKEKPVKGSDRKVFTDNVREKIFYGVSTDVVKEKRTASEHSVEEDKDENKNYYESAHGNKKILKDKIRNMVINKYASIRETDTKDNDVTKSTNHFNNGYMETVAGSDDLLNIPIRDSSKISCPSTTSKISIISEEIVDCSKLRELKKKHSQNVVDLTPVTIKTVITAKKTDDSKNTQESNTLLGIRSFSEESHKLNSSTDTQNLTALAINELNEKTSEKYNAHDNLSCLLVNNVNNSDILPTACLSNEVNINSLDGQLNTFKEHDHKLIHNGEDIEKESSDDSSLIKKCNKIELSPINISRLTNEETNSNNFTRNKYNEPILVYSKKTTNIEQHVITSVKSKISVQGVEKPGGEQNRKKQDENISKIIKTYQKRKMLIKPAIDNLTIKSTNNVVCLPHEVCTREIDEDVDHAESEYQGFCICEDFGNLHFYDDDREYEHIHFWKKDSTYVDPELIFSMYGDEQCNRYPDSELICTNMASERDCLESVNFCWNEYLFKESVDTKINISSGSSYDIEHSEEICNQNSTLIDDESREASTETLADNDENKSPIKKRSKEPSDILDNSNSNTNKIIEDNMALSKNVPLITMDGSKTTQSLKEVSTVHNNKESSSDPLPEQIAKDVEVPVPKRKRGRPRKIKPDITPESTEDCKESSDVKEDSKKNDMSQSNNDDEETSESGRRRSRRLNVTAEVSEDASDESVRPPRLCARRWNRIQSSLSTSTCNEDNVIQDTSENDEIDAQCGVCNEVIKSSDWIVHIAKEHDYLAWKEGAKPLDLNDELEVKNHLQNILKKIPALVCYTCGIRRKYITSYLKHKSTCEPTAMNVSLDSQGTVDHDESNVSLDTCNMNVSLKDCHDAVRCGVCSEEMKGTDWMHHIQREHNYIAWVDGETPLGINDASEVQKYLLSLVKKLGGLTCHKCGLVRKYPNIYLQHVKTCEAVGVAAFDSDTSLTSDGNKVQCAVCSKEVTPKEWKNHAMKKHYNVAWIVGATPIDVKNYYVVERYLKEYKNRYSKLVCRVCRDSKISCCGFYAHVIQCGKTEEEIDEYRELCGVCNKTYLCMYRSQHMRMHREKEYADERKLKLAEAREQAEQEPTDDTTMDTTGRRRAAVKARTVIAKYKDECKANAQKGESDGYSSDSDESVQLEQYTDDETDETDSPDGQYDISEDEYKDTDKRKRRPVDSNVPTVTRIPFPINNVRSYIHDSFEDFCNNHLTRGKLFPEWSDCEYQKLSEGRIDKYMPILKESCKVNRSAEGWRTYKRFQAENYDDCVILFAGASVQCVSWVPVNLDDSNGDAGNFLAVACHSEKDVPRYNCDETPEHSNLLQIWDFGDLQSSKPKLALGLAHDYGTIWEMDWCPSGARDLFKDKDDSHDKKRLGLVTIACSNGSAYIFSVPYPSAISVNDEIFYKIKPVAELRLSSMIAEKRKCQATSLRWSLQKGHNIIMVGYSNGTIAYFDLSNDSPLLVAKENGITIIHPFYDERSHNSCVTGVDLYAGGAGARGTGGTGGAACSSSASGARLTTGEVCLARDSTLLSSLACAGAFFLPHWPSAVLTAINSKVNQTVNELEWQSVSGARSGRRVGGVRARAPCVRCGALAAADDPLLTVLHAHPAHHAHHAQDPQQPRTTNNNTREHHDIHKQVAAILQMTSLAKKRKQTNDELAMKLEPLTYNDAVHKYGIEFELVPKRNKVCQQKALSIPMLHYPERYPLAEITSMSFCPTARFHNKLAVGTHAGIIFLINT